MADSLVCLILEEEFGREGMNVFLRILTENALAGTVGNRNT